MPIKTSGIIRVVHNYLNLRDVQSQVCHFLRSEGRVDLARAVLEGEAVEVSEPAGEDSANRPETEELQGGPSEL